MTPRAARGWAKSLTALGLALSLLLYLRAAHAEVTRYAVIIGNNNGNAREGRLHYAQRDAEKLRDTLALLGGFHPENTVLLIDKGAQEVQRVLISLNARIRSESAAPRDAMLLVYYSGHADGQGLHLGPDVLELALVKRLVQGSAAAFRVLVLDACRSGALTRVKGAHPIPAFDVALGDALPGEGVAFLTSSAAHEDAQESDGLQGSFFTHYLVSGLRGAADKNQNGDVSIEEAYDYAYHRTLSASSQTAYGLQHPTFAFDIKGKGGIALTWVGRNAPNQAVARLTIPPQRSYLIFADGPGGAVVAEVAALDLRREVALAPGRYFLRGRAEDSLLEGVVNLGPGQSQSVVEAELDQVQYARLARKGTGSTQSAHGPWLAARLRSPLWADTSWCPGLRAGYALELPHLSASLGLGACRSSFHNAALQANADELEAAVDARYVIDIGALSLGFGLELGGSWLRQTFSAAGSAPPRNSAAGRAGPLVSVSSELGRGFYWLLNVSGELYWFKQQQVSALARNPEAQLQGVPTLGSSLALGKYF